MRKLIRHLMLLLRLKQPIKNLLPTNLLTRKGIWSHLPDSIPLRLKKMTLFQMDNITFICLITIMEESLPSQSLTRVLIKIYLHLPTQRQEHLIIPNIWLMRKTEPILWHKNSNSHIPAL